MTQTDALKVGRKGKGKKFASRVPRQVDLYLRGCRKPHPDGASGKRKIGFLEAGRRDLNLGLSIVHGADAGR